MKKIWILLLLLILGGCTLNPDDFDIEKDGIEIVNLNDEIFLSSEDWTSENDAIVKIEGSKGVAVGTGLTYLKSDDESIPVYVQAKVTDIVVEGDNNVEPNTTIKLKATVVPTLISQEVLYTSGDENIATVDAEGNVTTHQEGLVTIYIESVFDGFVKEHLLLVQNHSLTIDELIENNIIEDTESISTLTSYFEPLIKTSSESVIGVSNYKNVFNKLTLDKIGSGIIYKRLNVYEDGSYKESDDLSDVVSFKYYVMTNRKVIADSDVLKIYYDSDVAEIEAEVVQYDDQVDLAVLTFTSRAYFPVAKLGDSDGIASGEFVFAIGNGDGYQYFRTASMGIISYPERYLSDDTDDDGISDWDALYIQHDAPINDGDNGGPLINLKGEVIGINTLKISGIDVDNFGFAIPIQYAKGIIETLEEGIKPQRATLKITGIEIKSMLAYPYLYPDYIDLLPEDITYGFYITEVNEGGIGSKAGMQVGDILVEYNNVDLRYFYLLRIEIGKFIIGSGEKVTAVVYRNGEYVELEVVY